MPFNIRFNSFFPRLLHSLSHSRSLCIVFTWLGQQFAKLCCQSPSDVCSTLFRANSLAWFQGIRCEVVVPSNISVSSPLPSPSWPGGDSFTHERIYCMLVGCWWMKTLDDIQRLRLNDCPRQTIRMLFNFSNWDSSNLPSVSSVETRLAGNIFV